MGLPLPCRRPAARPGRGALSGWRAPPGRGHCLGGGPRRGGGPGHAGRLGQGRPEVEGGVGTPGPPPVGAPGLDAEPLHGPAQPEIAAREGVRVAGPHQDVGHRPRAHAGQLREPRCGFLRVGPGVQVQPPGCARRRQRAQRRLPGGGEPEAGQIGGGEVGRPGEQHRQRPGRPGGGVQPGAVAGGQPPRQGAGRRDRHLLADHRAHRQLEAVIRAGHPQAGTRRDQRRERLVGGQRGGDRLRVGVEVEKLPAPGHHLADAAQADEPDPQQDLGPASRPARRGRPVSLAAADRGRG